MSNIGGVSYLPHSSSRLPLNLAQVRERVDLALTPGVKKWAAAEALKLARTDLYWPWEEARLAADIRDQFTPVARAFGFNIAVFERVLMFAIICRVMDALSGSLNSVGDDAQLANIDLQNVLQKQQQTLQTLSNISKEVYDTAMAVIRHIGS